MKLSELPAMLVERVERTTEALRLFGRFDRLDGVRMAGCFRLARGKYAWANLQLIDSASGQVVVSDARDPDVALLCAGERYTWFDDYWPAPLVEAIADETTNWRRFTFHASDAEYFRQGSAVVWQQLGGAAPEGAVQLGVRPNGWDHEHCDLCGDHIDAESSVAYTNDDGHFLCVPCYQRYGATHDVAFQLGV
jgi:hypothetical protein